MPEYSVIYPELGEVTNATIEYKCSHSGGFYLTTELVLKGRGIKMIGDGTNNTRKKKTYQVTTKAFEILKNQYDACYIALM